MLSLQDEMAGARTALAGLLLLVLLAPLPRGGRAERDCRVSGFRVQDNFDKARVGAARPPCSCPLRPPELPAARGSPAGPSELDPGCQT